MRESAQIIRFDQHHPDFCDMKYEDVRPTVNMQVYYGGIYCGTIETRNGAIEARGADWAPLGEFGNSDDAIVAIMAAADHVERVSR